MVKKQYIRIRKVSKQDPIIIHSPNFGCSEVFESPKNSKSDSLLGTETHDIYLNDLAYWKNIPDRVWHYTIGGYQVIKKWLSYREQALLGRSLKPEEVIEVTQMAKRIAAILLLEPELNVNYEAVKQATYPWSVQ